MKIDRKILCRTLDGCFYILQTGKGWIGLFHNVDSLAELSAVESYQHTGRKAFRA